MKVRSLVILIALSLSISSPLSVSNTPSNDHSYIITLDVCHASGSAVSVSANTPALQESLYNLCPPGLCRCSEIIGPLHEPSLVLVGIEHPPKSYR